MEFILYILSIVSNLEKSGVQRFKQCAYRSWNEEVMAVWRQPCKAERKFRSCENFAVAKSTCKNFTRCFVAAKPPTSTRVPLHKLKFHLRSCEPRCEISFKLRTKVRNHLQVANQVMKSSSSCEWSCEINLFLQNGQFNLPNQPFLAKWTIQFAKSICVISDICNQLS